MKIAKKCSTERDISSDSYDPYIRGMDRLNKTIDSMRSVAKMLIPHTYPLVPFTEEQDVLFLKQKQVVVDGNDIMLCYSDADYGEYTLHSLQVQSIRGPFMPFTLVCKVGRAFLGSRNLSYIEFFRNNKKVYCWTIKRKNGKLLPPGKRTKPGTYEGFDFRILNPGAVDLF